MKGYSFGECNLGPRPILNIYEWNHRYEDHKRFTCISCKSSPNNDAEFDTLEDVHDHLLAHAAAGDDVPDAIFEDVERELEEEEAGVCA